MSESGDIQTYAAYETETPGEFFFHEEFTTEAAFERHMKSPQLQKLLPQLVDHLDGPYTTWKISPVDP